MAYSTELPAETREKILKEAVDCALDLFFYTNRRFQEFSDSMKTELCELTLMGLVSHGTFRMIQEKDILPKLTPIWETGALKFEPDKPTDEFRAHLNSKHNVKYKRRIADLLTALKEWKKTDSAYRWRISDDTSEAERESIAENLFQIWLKECRRPGGYYLIRLSDAQSFGAWKEGAEKEANRISQANSRANKRAKRTAVTRKPKAPKAT